MCPCLLSFGFFFGAVRFTARILSRQCICFNSYSSPYRIPVRPFQYVNVLLPVVENNGFEPLTPCLQSRCSSQLS